MLMDKALQQLIQDIKTHQLTDTDLERLLAYTRDFTQGLRTLRTYAQGVTIFGSARLGETDKYYQMARELGGLLAQNGHSVITGGGPGIMEAANRGAFEYGGRSIGLNIILPDEQDTNPYLTDDLEFNYFFARRVLLTMSSKAYACFPGGFGTLDELSEILVLMQENKMPKMPVFLVGKSFWKPLEKFFTTRLLDGNFIRKNDLKLFTITDDVHEIVKAANQIGHPKVGDHLYD